MDYTSAVQHCFTDFNQVKQAIFCPMPTWEGFRLVTDCLKAQGVSLYTVEFWHHDGDDWRAELKRAHDFLLRPIRRRTWNCTAIFPYRRRRAYPFPLATVWATPITGRDSKPQQKAY